MTSVTVMCQKKNTIVKKVFYFTLRLFRSDFELGPLPEDLTLDLHRVWSHKNQIPFSTHDDHEHTYHTRPDPRQTHKSETR